MAYIRLILLFIMLLISVSVLTSCGSNEENESLEPLKYVEKSDEKMNHAIKEARNNLPHFWETKNLSSETGTSDFTLKVAFDVPGGGREHIWINDIISLDRSISNEKYEGVFANQPRNIAGTNIGDKVSFSEEQISDWGYQKNGKLIGYYTTHVLLPQMSERSAAEFLAIAGENP